LILFALLIWLFGNLVFIPIAASLNWQARIIVTLVLFGAFTILVVKALPNLKKLVDAISIFPARKFFMKKGLDYTKSMIASKQVLYIISLVIFYLLYLPFLSNFHPAISGIALIIVIIWFFFSMLKILRAVSKNIIDWLFS